MLVYYFPPIVNRNGGPFPVFGFAVGLPGLELCCAEEAAVVSVDP